MANALLLVVVRPIDVSFTTSLLHSQQCCSAMVGGRETCLDVGECSCGVCWKCGCNRMCGCGVSNLECFTPVTSNHNSTGTLDAIHLRVYSPDHCTHTCTCLRILQGKQRGLMASFPRSRRSHIASRKTPYSN
jgi:hypothetical protein